MTRLSSVIESAPHRLTHVVLQPDGSVSASEAVKLNKAGRGDEWFVIAPAAIDVHPELANLLAQAGAGRPDAGIFYGDDVAAATPINPSGLNLKPDWDPSLFLAVDYVSVPLCVRASVAPRLGPLEPRFGDAATYELLLRAHAMGMPITRIPQVLAYHGSRRLEASQAMRRVALEARAERIVGGPVDILPGRTVESLRVQRRLAAPPAVSIIVPTRQTHDPDANNTPFITTLLDSLAGSDYPMDRLKVLIGDDMADDEIYRGGCWPFRWERIVTRREPGAPFNYAAKMNRLWRACETELIVMLNDDVTVRTKDWLHALLSYAVQSDIGGVGARLLYPDGRIQHAGMAGGVFGLCTHPWMGESAQAPTYEDWALLPKEWSMVTGAVFATRRSLLEEVNGLDERFRLDFNDVDLCLKLRMAGYHIVYTPYAELNHHEKGSRGTATWPASELALFLNRWAPFLNNDPAYHPQLTRISHIIEPVALRHQWWQRTFAHA